MTRALQSNRVRAECFARGFDLAGITSLDSPETIGMFDAWLAHGYAGEMGYIERGAAKRRQPQTVFEGARSAIVVALDYGGREPSGSVARYARGLDYHDVMMQRLNEVLDAIRAISAQPVRGKPYVDTGPILERDLARRAGLGWFGKNTNLINPKLGSFFFLGALLVDLELETDLPFTEDRCGTCTRCLDACPTDALPEPRVLDANRCISYLTIELKGAIPEDLRPLMGDLIYGCDICQEVCPYNIKFAHTAEEPAFLPRAAVGRKDARTLAREVLLMSQTEFSAAFKGSPMKRAKLRGLKRNAAVVLGNVGRGEDVAVLAEALKDEEPLVREHVAWALSRLAADVRG